jgi:6-pyruvoyl-tetrahydropterin synthase
MFQVSNEFRVSYSHRVIKDVIDTQSTMELEDSFHGHDSRIAIKINAVQFLADKYVTQPLFIPQVKEKILGIMDHRFIVWKDDPIVVPMLKAQNLIKAEEYTFINVGKEDISPQSAFFHSLLILNFETTPDNLTRWIVRMVKASLPEGTDFEVSFTHLDNTYTYFNH